MDWGGDLLELMVLRSSACFSKTKDLPQSISGKSISISIKWGILKVALGGFASGPASLSLHAIEVLKQL